MTGYDLGRRLEAKVLLLLFGDPNFRVMELFLLPVKSMTINEEIRRRNEAKSSASIFTILALCMYAIARSHALHRTGKAIYRPIRWLYNDYTYEYMYEFSWRRKF